MAMDPAMENELMINAFPVHINPQDNDIEHIQAHQSILARDINGFVHPHIMEHIAQMKAKNQAAQGQPPQGQPPQGQGAPGVPGGAGPGVAGTPRMGAQPGNPRPQQPPGAVSRDQMPLSMPRKAGIG
jgi:hypothetical protein